MPLSVERVRRVEIWSAWQCAGGSRISIITDVVALSSLESVAGADRLVVSVPSNSLAIADLIEDRVIRVDESDTLFDEWKVVRIGDDTGTGVRTIEAAPLATTDLAGAGLLEQTLGDGSRIHDFEGVGLTVSQQITQFILPVLAAAGLTWVTLGTVAPLFPINVAYSWDSPLAALQRLAAASQSELLIRRVGTTGYAIDVIDAIGEGMNTADIRSQKNLPGLRIERTTQGQVTKLYPKGATNGEESSTMARATWKVTVVAGSVITIADSAGGDGPVVFDNQLDGLYLRKANGVLSLISASSATFQTVTVADASSIAVNDLIQFRASATGADLTWLSVPGVPVKSGSLDLTDIPGTNNLIKNPTARIWPGSVAVPPTNWAFAGTPAVLKQTAAPYVKTGSTSIQVTAFSSGDGVVTDAVPVFPTAERPFVALFASVWVVSGQVRVEAILTLPTGTAVRPVLPAIASSSIAGQWENLGITGNDLNLLTAGATAIAVRIVQNGTTPATFYVDSAQVTQSASQEPFVEGSGGTKLWQMANERLRTSGGPLVSYDASIVDLARLDPGNFGDNARVTLGAKARVREPRLTIAVTTRILEIERDYLIPGNTRLTLSNRPDDLAGTFARPKRVPRILTDASELDENSEQRSSVIGLNNFRVISETTSERTYGWTRGALVASVWAGVRDFDTPLPAGPWDAVMAE
ncbi:MAG: hypothetical protein H0U59_12645, partial [Gemmatimonadaceae bacterium]|nr:hypothetical protein [Gemmatimonadaceae bacterium]